MRRHSTVWLGLPVALGLAAAALLLAVLAPARVQAAGTVGDGDTDECTETNLLAALNGGGLVTFDCGPDPYTITLSARYAIITDTTIDGGGKITLSGDGKTGLFSVGPTATVHLRNLVLYNAVDSTLDGKSGAVYVAGTLVVSNTTFLSNTVTGLNQADGGAISNYGTLVVNNAAFISNTVTGGYQGGAIFNRGTLTVTNSNFYTNTAGEGGAIASDYGFGAYTPTVYITGSTFVGNLATGSSDEGGAVYDFEGQQLTIVNSVFHANAAGTGGAVYARAQSTFIDGSTFWGNLADEDWGGAIFAQNAFTLSNSSVYSNTAVKKGGGLFTGFGGFGMAWLYNVDLYGNVGYDQGGGYYSESDGVLEHVRVYNNRTDGALVSPGIGRGGGLSLCCGAVTVRHAEIYGNRADVTGGGLESTGVLTLDDVDVHHNTVFGQGGWGGGITMGDTNEGAPSTLNNVRIWANTVLSGGFNYAGGGLSALNSPITVTNSAIYSNTAVEGPGGGIYADCGVTLTLINTSVYSNAALSGLGGGLTASYNSCFFGIGAAVTLINTTFSGNHALAGGAVNNDEGNPPVIMTNTTVVSNTSGTGGVLTGAITLKNSLVAFNTPANCGDGVTSAGHNLESANTCGLGATGDVTGANPLIRPLAYNGGPNPANLTHALRLSSPAIDTADSAACPAGDQRGEPRPLDGDGDGTALCDKGAFELMLFRLFAPFLQRSP